MDKLKKLEILTSARPRGWILWVIREKESEFYFLGKTRWQATRLKEKYTKMFGTPYIFLCSDGRCAMKWRVK